MKNTIYTLCLATIALASTPSHAARYTRSTECKLLTLNLVNLNDRMVGGDYGLSNRFKFPKNDGETRIAVPEDDSDYDQDEIDWAEVNYKTLKSIKIANEKIGEDGCYMTTINKTMRLVQFTKVSPETTTNMGIKKGSLVWFKCVEVVREPTEACFEEGNEE